MTKLEYFEKDKTSPSMYKHQAEISQYLSSRGVVGFIFGGGTHGLTGPEITINNCTSEMGNRLIDACTDAFIRRGGAGMGATNAYCQIDPKLFSDPRIRAEKKLSFFEECTKAGLPLPNDFYTLLEIYIDDKANLIGESGAIVYQADSRTRAMMEALNVNDFINRPTIDAPRQ